MPIKDIEWCFIATVVNQLLLLLAIGAAGIGMPIAPTTLIAISCFIFGCVATRLWKNL